MKKFINFISEQTAAEEGLNAHNIVYHSFLMCPPFNLATTEPNNILMKRIPEKDREVNRKTALHQFTNLYNFMASQSLVYLLPHDYSLQDQSFVANLGIVLPHWDEGHTVVISEFKSPPRVNEQKPGLGFFYDMNFDVRVSPYHFEGEADLKYMNNNNYIGAYGIRTSLEALNWFEKNFDMNIVKVENNSETMYHLDCLVYPLYSNVVLAVTSMLSKKNIKDIEKFAYIVDVPDKINGDGGITNCVGINKLLLCASTINSLKVTDKEYDYERDKVDFLNKVCAQHGLEAVFFNLSEYKKNGADLSCMVMHLNYVRHGEEFIHGNNKKLA